MATRLLQRRSRLQRKETKKEYVFGYKLHVSADVELEAPLISVIAPANKHNKTFFHQIYGGIKNIFTINYDAKYPFECSLRLNRHIPELHYDNVRPVIATNGRGFYKSKPPKDPEYDLCIFMPHCLLGKICNVTVSRLT
jgi:hypothetical protein